MNELVVKPLSELTYFDTFQDEQGNTYTVTDNEDENGVEITFSEPNFSQENKLPRFIGKITSQGVYRKYEREKDVYVKENAWTINTAILCRATSIEYFTDSRTYSISAKDALALGHPVKMRSETKQVVPKKYWTVTSSDPKESRRIELLGVEWADKLATEFQLDYMAKLAKTINAERKNSPVYPEAADVFKAFKLTPFSEVKVVIIGQDPYPQPYANGLAFGVNSKADKIPYSLQQLQLELNRAEQARGFLPTRQFDASLESWAEQGVLLLNSNLTVGKSPGSHSGYGWENFTTRVITELNNSAMPIVFLFWGRKSSDAYAHLVDQSVHCVLQAVHPAASAYADYKGAGFVGCQHFDLANEFLKKTYGKEINW